MKQYQFLFILEINKRLNDSILVEVSQGLCIYTRLGTRNGGQPPARWTNDLKFEWYKKMIVTCLPDDSSPWVYQFQMNTHHDPMP